MELEALSKAAPRFSEAGATLMLISPQLVAHNEAFAKEKHLAVDILSDPGNQVAASFGLRWTVPPDLKALYLKFGTDLAAYNGEDSWSLPMPARYVIDGQGVIRHADINADYTQRPDPEETLRFLTRMR
jgi:peroxiredoxin